MSDELIVEGEATAAVVKRGETCIITTLSRTALGLSMRVKTHPAVELFMRGLAAEDATPMEVALSDRYWVPIGKQPLLAYRLAQILPPVINPVTGGPLFALDRLSRPLIDTEDGRLGDVPVNLSFLRLIGISEGAGVSFQIRGVHSLDSLRLMQDRLQHAQQQFYINYIRPVNLSVITSTQEIQL